MNVQILNLFDKYLSKTASDDDISELNRWISANEPLRLWLEKQIENSSDEMDETTKSKIFERIEFEIQKQNKIAFRVPVWLRTVAAILLLVLITGVAMSILKNSQVSDVQFTEVGASRGQKASLTLPDGTKVVLNSETTLKYCTNFNNIDRKIELNGEAYFDVAKNKNLPFVVKAGAVEVEALGTSFNVKAYPEEDFISTTLLEGKVQVRNGEDRISLVPNERLEYNVVQNAFNKVNLMDAQSSISWMRDKLSFENATLAEVVAAFSRIYNVKIQFASESIKKQRFTGQINNNSLPSVLRILSLTSPIRFEQQDSVVTLYEVPSEKKLFRIEN